MCYLKSCLATLISAGQHAELNVQKVVVSVAVCSQTIHAWSLAGLVYPLSGADRSSCASLSPSTPPSSLFQSVFYAWGQWDNRLPYSYLSTICL